MYGYGIHPSLEEEKDGTTTPAYIGSDSPSIIRYLEPVIGEVFKTRFHDCHFTETMTHFKGSTSRLATRMGQSIITMDGSSD